MSLEGGGRSDKFGNEFEKNFVISLAIRVVRGEYSSIHWEPLIDCEGIEGSFTTANGKRIVFQCKEQNSAEAKWTMPHLALRGILANILQQLRLPNVDGYLFVSRDVCTMEEIKKRAAHCNNDVTDFRKQSLTRKYCEPFNRLCAEWQLDPTKDLDIRQLFFLLKKIDFARGYSSEHELAGLRSDVSNWLHGEPDDAIGALANILSTELGNNLSSARLRELLHQTPHSPRDLINNPTIPAAIERITKDYFERQQGLLIRKDLLSRKESREVLAELTSQTGARVVFVSGEAGAGKSGVLFEIVQSLRKENVPVFAFSFSDYRPEVGLHEFAASKLGLPSAPGQCLHMYGGGEKAVLIVDQLDAVRWTGAHSDEAWRVCRELLDEALTHPELRLLVACRSFDLKGDQSIQQWKNTTAARLKHAGDSACREIEVGLIPEEDVRKLLTMMGQNYDTFSQNQKKLLQQPFCLNLWCELVLDSAGGTVFSTRSALLSGFIERRLERVVQQQGIPATTTIAVLDKIAEFCDKRGRQDMPLFMLSEGRQIVNLLCASGLLVCMRNDSLRFTHQLLLDFKIAQRVAREACDHGNTPLNWVRQHDQALFRREQLRQLLTLLRDSDHSLYIKTLNELFYEVDIRFHLRHLALRMLGEIDSPTDAEAKTALTLLADPKWRVRVIEDVLFGRAGWFTVLVSRGIINAWVTSNDSRMIDDALTLCRGCFETLPESIISALAPFWNDVTWRKRIASVFPYKIRSEHPTVFEWHCDLIREGYITLNLYDFHDFRKTAPERIILLFAAFASAVVKGFANRDMNAVQRESRDAASEIRTDIHEVLCDACCACPRLAWLQILPLLKKLVEININTPWQLF